MRGNRGRWLFLIVLLGGVTAFTGLWYAAAGNQTGTQPAFGGVYVEGVTGTPQRINPLFASQNTVDETLVSLIYAGLTGLDANGSPYPHLAETWDVSQDGKTYTFRLRPGLLWPDGAAITTNDVVFTYDTLRAPGLRTTSDVARLLAGARITRVDERNVAFTLEEPFAPLPAYLTFGILPSHLLKDIRPNALYDDAFNQHPVGAGPYRLQELSPERAVLEASPTYHLGQPFVQRMELRFYRDEGALLLALKERNVNGAFLTGAISESDIVALEARRDLRLNLLPTSELTSLYFNLNRPLFQDRRLRQALLYALDRDDIVMRQFNGQARTAGSPIAFDSWAYTPALSRYGTDPNAARVLLSEAGWLPGSDGIRTRNGASLSFKLAVSTDPVNVAIAHTIAERWRAIGVQATVESIGSTALVRDKLEPRDFDAVLFATVAGPDPDPYPYWHSSQTGQKEGNLSSLKDERIDRLLVEARQIATQARRKEVYVNFQELFAQEVPSIPLYVSTALYVQPLILQGTRPGLVDSPSERFWQVHEWYLRVR